MAQDIQLTNFDGDLKVANGDFVIAKSDNQHIKDIISDYPGYWKEHLLIGVGLEDYQNADIGLSLLSSNIISQIKSDGAVISRPKITRDIATSELIIVPNAYYPY